MITTSFSSDRGRYESAYEGATLIVDRVRSTRDGQLGGEVTVHVTEPIERQIHSTWATLTTTDGRSKLAKHLHSRADEISADDWQAIVEDACVRVRDSHRIGEPAIHIENAPDLVEGDAQLRDSTTGDAILPRNELTIAFGDGDTGKSMVALLFAAVIHAGRNDLAGIDAAEPTRVAFADWETSAATQKARLRRMFGEGYPKDLVYIPGGGLSLPDSVDRFRRIIREERIGYLIVDSIAYSAGGPPEEASIAAAYLNSLQQLGLGTSLGVLAIAHVTKADTRAATEKPFGSAFWSNSARMTWFMRRNEGHGDRYTVGMFCKKHNLGRRSRSIGLTLDYANGGLIFTRSDVTEDAELAGTERLSVRIHRLLLTEAQPLTYAAIGEALDVDAKVAAETCRRGIGTMFAKVPGDGREVRIGLMAKGADVA